MIWLLILGAWLLLDLAVVGGWVVLVEIGRWRERRRLIRLRAKLVGELHAECHAAVWGQDRDDAA